MAITACTLTHLGPLPAESPNGTSSGISIGTAFADRLVVILIAGDFTGASLSGAVGGTNLSQDGIASVISAFIPSGTTTTLTVTGGTTLPGAPVLDFPICAVYAIAGATSNAPTDVGSALGSASGGTTPMTANIDVLSDGAIIAAAGDGGGAGTAFTAGVDSDGTATPGVSVRAGSREYASGGTFAVTNAGNYALLVASFAGSGGGPTGYTLPISAASLAFSSSPVDFTGAISKAAYKGAANGTTSATIPTHAVGDLIIAKAFRDGSTTQPTQPTGVGWNQIMVQAGTTCCARWAYKFASSSSETTGTWTNASALEIAVYSGIDRIGASASQAGTAASVTYPALTMQFGNSWVLSSAGHRSVNTTLETPPSGMTFRNGRVDAVAEAAVFDTNGLVTSFSSRSVNVGGTASGWVSGSIELIPQWRGTPTSGTGYTLTVDAATMAFTAQAVGLRAARKLPISAASLAFAAQSVGLRAARKLAIDPASITFTANDVILARGYRLPVTPASLSFTGNNVGLRAARQLPISPASLAFTAQAVRLAAGRNLPVSAASMAFTAYDVSLKATRVLPISPASIAVTGQDVRLAATRKLPITQASLVFTAYDVALDYSMDGGYRLAISPASMSFTANDVGFTTSKRLTISTAALAFTGWPVNLRAARQLPMAPGSYAFASQPIGMRATRRLPVATAAIAVTANPVRMATGRVLKIETASMSFTANPVGMIYTPAGHYRLTIETAACVFDAKDVAFTVERGAAPMTMDRLYDLLMGRAWHERSNAIRTLLCPRVGGIAPNGSVVPQFIGQRYLDNDSRRMYVAIGLTLTSWAPLTP